MRKFRVEGKDVVVILFVVGDLQRFRPRFGAAAIFLVLFAVRQGGAALVFRIGRQREPVRVSRNPIEIRIVLFGAVEISHALSDRVIFVIAMVLAVAMLEF